MLKLGRLLCLLAMVAMTIVIPSVANAGERVAAKSASLSTIVPAGSDRNGPDLYEPTAGIADCNPGNVCFWVHAGYVDGPGQLSGTNPDWRVFSHASCPRGNWNDCASSVYNAGRSCKARLHEHINYAGDWLGLPRGVGVINLEIHDFNDQISSNSWYDCV
jgi:hypothetical protein